jgi:thioredoxin-related protein
VKSATRWLGTLGFLLLSSIPSGAAQLLMTEHRACRYCAQFNREVGKVYSETEAGELAPLRRVSRLKKWPADLAAITPAYHTPVFILVEDGREVGRFAGYVGEEAFWQQLNPLLAKLEQPAADGLPDFQASGRSGLF